MLQVSTAINSKGQPFPGEPLIMALLLSQHKMIEWLTKQISKYESLDNKKEDKESEEEEEEEEEEELDRENTSD